MILTVGVWGHVTSGSHPELCPQTMSLPNDRWCDVLGFMPAGVVSPSGNRWCDALRFVPAVSVSPSDCR